MNNTGKIIDKERICVIVPTYNNGSTIIDVIKRIYKYTNHVIVVNDGCTDQTAESLEQAAFEHIEVVTNKKNKGKGSALKEGFKKAIHLGYEYAITIDADGQHYPEDIPLLVDAHLKNKGSFITGERTLNPELMRNGSNFANKFSNFWFIKFRI